MSLLHITIQELTDDGKKVEGHYCQSVLGTDLTKEDIDCLVRLATEPPPPPAED